MPTFSASSVQPHLATGQHHIDVHDDRHGGGSDDELGITPQLVRFVARLATEIHASRKRAG